MAKRIVHEIDFKKDGAHVALVTKAANGEEVLLMKKKNEKVELKKAEEVKITTSMQTFLTTFFYMWREDAAELAEVLGYEPQEWSYEMIGEDTSVELLKSLDSDTEVSKELFENIEKMSKEFNDRLIVITKQKEEDMAKKKEEKVVDLEKQVEESGLAVELEKQKTEMAELKKALEDEKAKREDLEKSAEKKEKDEMVELCKGYSFVEDADVLAESLFLCKGIKGFNTILETLEKARDAIKASLEKEIGTDEEADLIKSGDNEINVDKTTELLKKRNSKESK